VPGYSAKRPLAHMHVRSPGTVSALIMAHQIDLFCVPQLADTGCLEADHNGGYLRGFLLTVSYTQRSQPGADAQPGAAGAPT
jgi:hypothetical protein